MTQLAKLYAALFADPRSTLSFRDFERLLRAFGFEHVRTSGSHRIYTHPLVPRPFSVQPSARDAKHYQKRQLLDLVEAHHLDMQA
jgi:predicted RNA binding protein YcfA (HicA-like mRNA interferase family)